MATGAMIVKEHGNKFVAASVVRRFMAERRLGRFNGVITKAPSPSTLKRGYLDHGWLGSIAHVGSRWASITLDPSNATFYNNRALVRVRLQMWDDAISDCLESIRLQPRNMKAYYNLAQAQMGLHHPNEALTSALTAYEFCLAMGDTSANNISALILRAKKEKWELRERERIRRRSGLLIELEDSLHAARMSERRAIGDSLLHYEIDDAEAKAEFDLIEDAYAQKLDEIRKVFAVADPGTERRVSLRLLF